ncbi:hypothetical protein [Nitrosopumilus sp. SJ]|uniref:hypothetical protein n=1 Tax=Nitrosopumilus sp. SJ TaxID=1027374 RepID=UPI00036D488D|nr:hypothetical protein [Nitrosopumilus sp. SJ]
MKIRIQLIDDAGVEHSGEIELKSTTVSKKNPKKQSFNDYSGLKGGINFLIDHNFFDQLKSSKDVNEELKKENYFHTIQSVDKRLRFLVSSKILTRIRDEGKWKYALRK